MRMPDVPAARQSKLYFNMLKSKPEQEGGKRKRRKRRKTRKTIKRRKNKRKNKTKRRKKSRR